ncbi:MAG: phosphohydrolase [Actinomycetota bacterium]
MTNEPIAEVGLVSDQPPWMTLTTPAEVADAIADLYERRGNSMYDEVVSQNAHATQCGQLAIDAGASVPTVVAAFLHDIGHLFSGAASTVDVDHHHEAVGSRFLANWFPSEVTEPIRLHVAAKRYLCAVDAGYRDGLSPASAASLALQGGPMGPDEADEFAARSDAAAAIELRRWDDLAKVVDASVPDLATFRDLMEATVSAGERDGNAR